MSPQFIENHTIQGAFRALADPTRRDILRLLGQHDMTIAELSSHFPITRAAVKKHLDVLKHGELISVRPAGRERVNRLEPAALERVSDWLGYFSRYWDQRLDALQKAVDREGIQNFGPHHPDDSQKEQ